MIGDHMVKSWSTAQSVIALSTGEAELYGLNKCGASALGLQSLLEDLGVSLDIRLHTDATTVKAIATRRGLGEVRHIAVNELWLQEQVARKKVVINKLKNKFNVADILTKHLSKYDVDQIVYFCNMNSQRGAMQMRQNCRYELDINKIMTMNSMSHFRMGLEKDAGAPVRRKSFEPKSVDKPLLGGALV